MNFYYLPSRRCVILWSQKCACTAIARWIKKSFHEAKNCQKGLSARTYLAANGYNFKDLDNLNALTDPQLGGVKHAIVSYRDPISRITSSFVNKFHVYETRTIFNGDKRMQGFSYNFARKLAKDQRKNQNIKRQTGDFSLKEMINYLHKRQHKLDEINPHFTPQIYRPSHLEAIQSLRAKHIKLHPLQVERLTDDLKIINKKLSLKYTPPHFNSTEKPGDDWSFSDHPELTQMPISELFKQKLIPKSGALRSCLATDMDLQKKVYELFHYDSQLMSFMTTQRRGT